jgi:hypothetical protein
MYDELCAGLASYGYIGGGFQLKSGDARDGAAVFVKENRWQVVAKESVVLCDDGLGIPDASQVCRCTYTYTFTHVCICMYVCMYVCVCVRGCDGVGVYVRTVVVCRVPCAPLSFVVHLFFSFSLPSVSLPSLSLSHFTIISISLCVCMYVCVWLLGVPNGGTGTRRE